MRRETPHETSGRSTVFIKHVIVIRHSIACYHFTFEVLQALSACVGCAEAVLPVKCSAVGCGRAGHPVQCCRNLCGNHHAMKHVRAIR